MEPMHAAADRWVDSTDGVAVALHDLGGDGPPLLLAHATGFAGRIWEPVRAHLPGWHCLAFDARGHGASRTPETADLSWLRVADDVLAAVDAFGLQGCVAAGHSMGAAALLLAELARPGTFRALYCYEPVTSPIDTDEPLRDHVLAEMTLRRRDRFPSRDAARANFAAKPPFDACTPDSLDAYLDQCWVRTGNPAEPDERTLACRRDDESTFYRLGRAHGLYERLGGVACPVVVAAGVVEPGAPSSFAARVVERLPQAQLMRYDDLGHFGPQQDPARIAADLDAALRPWAGA